MTAVRNTLCKEERLHGRNAIEQLFKKAGSRSMVAFPLRAVYALTKREDDEDLSEEEGGEEKKNGVRVKMLASVPKRQFKRAVKRNRVKRQIREAFRKNKHPLSDAVAEIDSSAELSVAFIWIDNNLHPSAEVEKKVQRLLLRIEEKLRHDNTSQWADNNAGKQADGENENRKP